MTDEELLKPMSMREARRLVPADKARRKRLQQQRSLAAFYARETPEQRFARIEKAKIAAARRYASDPELANAKIRKWRAKNPELVKEQARRARTPEAYERSQEWRLQPENIDRVRTQRRTNERKPEYRAKKAAREEAFRRADPIKFWCQNTLTAVRGRARRSSREFDLTLQFLMSIANERCPYLGLRLCYGKHNKTFIHESPSLDRINNDRGYTTDNVEIISWRANSLKKDASPEELIAIGTRSHSLISERRST